MLRFETAGESHGECLVATLTGLPAGVPVSIAAIDRELWRRQQGFGRGGRMKIETDKAHIVSGVRHSKTIGSPIAILLENKDWKNWTEALPVEDIDGGEEKKKPVTRPRPGHADLAGCIKYDFHDARYILERASARETTARVAVGAFAKAYLAEFGDPRPEPRDRGRRRAPRTAGFVGRTGRAEQARRSASELRGSRGRTENEGSGRSRLQDRGHRRAAFSKW